MKEDHPRVFGYRPSPREARLWWVFKIFLTLVTCLAAIQGVRSVYYRASDGFGFDFYQFWLGGDVLRKHIASGRHEVLDLYTDAAHVRIGQEYFDLARTKSRRQREVAADRKVLDTNGSPFFYWAFSIASRDDYDRQYAFFIALSVACMVGTMSALAWRLRYSMAGIGLAIALICISAPVRSEFAVANVNFLQLLFACVYLLLRERARGSTRFALPFHLTAGFVAGWLVAFKPNLLLLPVFIGFSDLASRRWQALLAEAGGFALAVVSAVAISSHAFGGFSSWLAWGKLILDFSGRTTMPSGYGNFSPARNIYEATGRSLVGPLSVIGIVLAIAAIWKGRRCAVPKLPVERTTAGSHTGNQQPATDNQIEFGHDLAVFGIAVAVMLLTSGVAWLHYPILLFPFLLLAASPLPGRIGLLSQIMRYSLLAIVIVLLLFPPAEEIQVLLPFHIEENIRIWIHCTQAAVVITLGLALWFESRWLFR